MEGYKAGDWKRLNEQKVKNIQQNLTSWYKKNHRKLPWREACNPYYIWVSEVMLQQTRVETVISYFSEFIKKFPTIEKLAGADEDEVLKMWQGLGYYSRARNLYRGAKVIMKDYDGKIPGTMEEIQKIPGIGPYTAGAILSIAFGQPVPAVDGNVMRVFSRVFHIKWDIGDNKTRKEMENIGKTIVCRQYPSYFNQALMELGAVICTPSSPKCMTCPLYQECKARALGVQKELPVKKTKKKVKEIELELAVIWKGKKLLITKRPTEGLLANLWALPSVKREKDLAAGESIILDLKETFGLQVNKGKEIVEKQHAFTHIKWKMKAYAFQLLEESTVEYPEIQWVLLEEIKNYAFPTAFLKVIEEIKKG